MQGKTEVFTAAGRRVCVYRPPVPAGEALPAAYLNDGEMVEEMLPELAAAIEKELAGGRIAPFLLVGIHSPERDAEYTPWPAPAAFSKGAVYPGQADGYLQLLEEEIKPQVERRCAALPAPEQTALAGYSLGGLCALYAAFRSGSFGRIASVCGSLWYPDWPDFVRENAPAGALAALFISLGKKEPKPGHPLLAGLGEAAERTGELLAPFCARRAFAWHEGGHFTHAPQRLAQALCWLYQKEGSDEKA